jgi:hypothetical protein
MGTFILKRDEWLSEELGKDAFNLVKDDSGEKLRKILADIPSSYFVAIKVETNDIEAHIDLGSNNFF